LCIKLTVVDVLMLEAVVVVDVLSWNTLTAAAAAPSVRLALPVALNRLTVVVGLSTGMGGSLTICECSCCAIACAAFLAQRTCKFELQLRTSRYGVQGATCSCGTATNDEHIEFLAAHQGFDLFTAHGQSALAFGWTLHGIVDLQRERERERA